jgi:hypothetical protein
MSKDKKEYSSEFKAKVVLEASSAEGDAVQQIADKYNVTTEEIAFWAREMGISDVSSADDSVDEVTLEAKNESFLSAIDFGAQEDVLNYKRLTFWTVFGTIFVLVIVVSLIYVFDSTISKTQQEVSAQSNYFDVNELKTRDAAKLSSFGVVDPENGIYRIPVDSAITLMLSENQ